MAGISDCKDLPMEVSSNWGPQSLKVNPKEFQNGMESDRESDTDFYKKLSVKELSDLDPDDVIMSNDEEDDDFTVHYVHHGKKTGETDNKMDLMQQITELQEAVGLIKGSLTEAMTSLGGVADDKNYEESLQEIKEKCESHSTEIVLMIMDLKREVSLLKTNVNAIEGKQSSIQKAIHILINDRKALAAELADAGVITQHTRTRLECVSGVVEVLGGSRSGSSSNSNDSGVALLLEKAQNAYTDDINGNSTGQRSSDQESLPDHPSLLVPSSVYDYVAGLTVSQPSFSLTSANSQDQCANSVETTTEHKLTDDHNSKAVDNDDLGLGYDSDSSLTIAANKSISLTDCISQEIRVNDDKTPNDTSLRKRASKTTEGNLNVQNKETNTPNRKRRPLLGVSSTAMYQPTNHFHSDKERGSHHHRHKHKKGPQESQRYKIAKELLDTEKKYCKTLWVIQDTFAEPLKKASILSNKDLSTLFPEEVYLLYDKHCLLQHQLRERLASWKWHPLLGDILSRFTDPRQSDILRLYSSYVNDFPEVLKTFHKLCKASSSFTKFVKNCLDQPTCGGLDLGAFLLTPVQRVPRYILLMKQLLKHTDPMHPDYRNLNICLERLRDFLARLNDAMEHSFRLVHSSSILNPGNMKLNDSSCSDHCQQHSETDTAKYMSSIDIQGSRQTSANDDVRSPQRSLSSASRLRGGHPPAGRSSSLPRTSYPESQESEDTKVTERHRTLSGGYQQRSLTVAREESDLPPKTRTLLSARSVTDVSKDLDSLRVLSELAASEPSLLENRSVQTTKSCFDNRHQRSANQKLVTWTDSVSSADDTRSRKKTSIKTSLKNMFKKRGHRGDRNEQIYWHSSISEPGNGATSHSPPPPTYPSPLTQAIGDFLDEDGNPCSNV